MDTAFLIAVTLSALITIAVRAMPIVLLSRIQLPVLIYEWLSFIPSAIMSSIIATEILTQPALTKSGWSMSALAALCCIIVGSLTRSLVLTVLSGIATFMAFQWIVT